MSMDHSHPGGMSLATSIVSSGTISFAPHPPSFAPNDRYVEPGDCTALGHVFTFNPVQQNWRCVGCQKVAPAGRPAPARTTEPAYPMPDPVTLPKPDTTLPNRPSWQPGGPIPMMPDIWRQPILPTTPCAFENLPADMQGKPLGLVCHCPKCSAWC